MAAVPLPLAAFCFSRSCYNEGLINCYSKPDSKVTTESSPQETQAPVRDRSIFSRLLPVSLFIFVFGGWFALEAIFIKMTTPDPEIDTFAEWIEWYPEAEQFTIVSEDPPRLLALGPPIGFVVSGPSAVVFDATGTMVDQTREIGEGTEFETRWGIELPLDTISQKDAREWFEEHSAEGSLRSGTL